jgi:antitoxin VapB
MALNLKDAESERLAAEIAALTGETKTGAIRTALRERRERLSRCDVASTADRRERLERALEELWSQLPVSVLDRPPLTRAERESILGLGPDGA